MTVKEELKPRAVAIGALVTVVFYLSGLFVILTPLPLIYLSALSGRKNSFYAAGAAFITTVALYFLLLGVSEGAGKVAEISIPLPGVALSSFFSVTAIKIFGGSYLLFFITIGITLGEAVRLDWGFLKGGTRAVVFALILSFVIIFLYGVSDIVSWLREYLVLMVNEIVRIEQEAGVATVQTEYLAKNAKEISLFVLRILPAIIFGFTLLAVFINMLLSRRVIRSQKLFSNSIWDFASFKIPDALIWGIISAALAFFAGSYLFSSDWVKFFGINFIIIFVAIYFFQGLAITMFFIRRMHLSFMRIAVYVTIILFFQVFMFLMVALGLADTWLNFRERVNVAKEE